MAYSCSCVIIVSNADSTADPGGTGILAQQAGQRQKVSQFCFNMRE